MSQTPQAKYRKDYKAPSHTITDIDLTFDLYDHNTVVTAVSQVKQQGESDVLELDGEALKLISVAVNGEAWSAFEVKESSLLLSNLPAEFELVIVTEIDQKPTPRWKACINRVVLSVHNVKLKVLDASHIT